MASDLDSSSSNSNSNRLSTTYDDVLSPEETSQGNVMESKGHAKNKDNENQEASEFCGTDGQEVVSRQVPLTSRPNMMDQEKGEDVKDETLSNDNTLVIPGIVETAKQNTSEEFYEDGGVEAPLEKRQVVKSDKDGDDFHIPRKESDGDKRRLHREGDKELWMLPKSNPCKDDAIHKDSGVNSATGCQTGDSLEEDSPDSQPVKPPRRHTNKKQDVKEVQLRRGRGAFDQTLFVPNTSPEGDPIKPPRRHLPQIPNAAILAEPQNSKKPNLEVQLSGNSDALSGTVNDTGVSATSPKEIICNPILASSPNQVHITHLTIESFDALDTSRRVLSFIDESAGSGVRKVESFYDLLHSPPASSILQVDDRIGSTLSDSDEHLYDSVPLEYSSVSGLDKKGSSEAYDEVIVNQEAYVMPPRLEDDSDDQFSEADPWGSDFETDDELTDGGSFKNQDDNIVVEDPYDSVEISPITERKRPFKFVSNLASLSPFSGIKKTPLVIPNLKGCLGLSKSSSLPYLASDQKVIEEAAYVEPDFTDSVKYQQPVMPPMPAGLSNEQVKRHQIVKFMLESEADYMRLLDQLSKQYELPIRDGDLLEPNKIDNIFQHVHRVLQCHVMFNIALSDRMTNWTPDEKIGDVLYALFCTAMVLDAYSGYVNNFTKAMNTVKVACRTHVAFARFLKARRQASREGYSLHHLMLKPIQRFPQILALLQELLLVTPKGHPDRSPLQLALTQLECLAENLKERKREAELRNKVKLLDALVAQTHKPLASGNRYFVRQDDFVQCVVEGESILGTKKRRIIMLSDMLLCVSFIKGKRDRAKHMITDFKAKYKLKWNVPLNDVDIVEYGPGVDVHTNLYKTTISYSKEGQYRKAYSGCQEHFEDLQQDLAVIGQIAGLVGTLRRSYQVLDIGRVQRWHKAVQRTIEEETRLANLYWLELSLPSKQDRVNYIFSTDSPTVKAEWVTTINTCKLRLAPENNPGWYLPEDDGTGGVAIQRRNMPLLKDNTNLFLLNQNSQIQCIVSCPDTSDPLPGIHDNYNNLWLLCSSGGSAGYVTVVSVSLSSPPKVIESFHVCESSILCGEYVERTHAAENKIKRSINGRLGFPFPTVWLGTQDGRIFIYNALDSTRRYVMAVKLPDAVLDIKAVNEKIFAGIANGSVVVFKRNRDGTWNFSEPKAVGLGKLPVMAMTVVGETLWCGCGNNIFIMDHVEELVKHVIEVDENPKTSVKHVISYGVGVWISLWKLPTIKLFHSETLQHVQDISVASPVTNMQRDIDSQLEKTKLDKIYVTALVADEGLLWVGTSVGVTLVFPLPFLEGVPLVSGKACVAFHSYCDRLRCLYPLKNNPSPDTGIHGAEENPEFKLFREHEVRDASVQTDSGISGAWSYAARGPALAEIKKASPGKTSKKSTTVQANSDLSGENSDDFSDEDVHSDDEFNFIEDRGKRTTNGIPAAGSVTAGTSSAGSFSVRFEEADDPYKSLSSSVRSGDFVGKTEFHVDDFARMLSEFKGFSSSTPPSIPEPPRMPLVMTNAPSSVNEPTNESGSSSGAQETGEESSRRETAAGSVRGDSAVARPSQQESEGIDDDFRSRVKSVGDYVKLTEARAVAEAQGISLEPSKENADSSVRDNEQKHRPEETRKSEEATKPEEAPKPEEVPKPEVAPKLEVAPKPQVERGVDSLDVTSVNSPSPGYVDILNPSDPLQTARTPEIVYDSPRQDDSYSAFERSATHQGDEDGSLTVPKVENLKPRLSFPVLLVSAGEGYADLRRKRPDDNDKESRLMIWQIN